MAVLTNLRRKLRPILKRYRVRQAILFGSLARGEDTSRSDLDLILVQDTDKRFLDRYDGILADVSAVAGNRDVDLLIYTPEELEAISERPFIARALREGKVIYESG